MIYSIFCTFRFLLLLLPLPSPLYCPLPFLLWFLSCVFPFSIISFLSFPFIPVSPFYGFLFIYFLPSSRLNLLFLSWIGLIYFVLSHFYSSFCLSSFPTSFIHLFSPLRHFVSFFLIIACSLSPFSSIKFPYLASKLFTPTTQFSPYFSSHYFDSSLVSAFLVPPSSFPTYLRVYLSTCVAS